MKNKATAVLKSTELQTLNMALNELSHSATDIINVFRACVFVVIQYGIYHSPNNRTSTETVD
jgi:hypothetical protein